MANAGEAVAVAKDDDDDAFFFPELNLFRAATPQACALCGMPRLLNALKETLSKKRRKGWSLI